jgi:hypothetical protein
MEIEAMDRLGIARGTLDEARADAEAFAAVSGYVVMVAKATDREGRYTSVTGNYDAEFLTVVEMVHVTPDKRVIVLPVAG